MTAPQEEIHDTANIAAKYNKTVRATDRGLIFRKLFYCVVGSGLFDDDCRPDLAAFLAADEAEALGGGGFDGDAVDVRADDLGECGAHRVDVRSEFRGLEGDGDVGVAKLVAFGPHQPRHLFQKQFAVNAFPTVVVVREVQSDVT